MQSPEWTSTAIFLAWDDWGGFYDHVVPPQRRRERATGSASRAADLPVREAGLHRPPDALVRRLPEVHRGRLPRRRSASTRRPTAGRTRGRASGRTRRSSGTWSASSTSPRRRARRRCCRRCRRCRVVERGPEAACAPPWSRRLRKGGPWNFLENRQFSPGQLRPMITRATGASERRPAGRDGEPRALRTGQRRTRSDASRFSVSRRRLLPRGGPRLSRAPRRDVRHVALADRGAPPGVGARRRPGPRAA